MKSDKFCAYYPYKYMIYYSHIKYITQPPTFLSLKIILISWTLDINSFSLHTKCKSDFWERSWYQKQQQNKTAITTTRLAKECTAKDKQRAKKLTLREREREGKRVSVREQVLCFAGIQNTLSPALSRLPSLKCSAVDKNALAVRFFPTPSRIC